MVDEVLVFMEVITNLGTFNLIDEIGMSVACTKIVLYFRIGRYTGNLQRNRLRKSPMAWRFFSRGRGWEKAQ